MRKCGIEGFRFGDLVQPDKDRLVFLLSGVINFARFCGGNQELPQELQARASKTREEKVKLRKELHQIEASIIELE
jgi:hypothetical protein